LAELVISVKCLGNDLEKQLEVLRKMFKSKASSEESNEKVGFSAAPIAIISEALSTMPGKIGR
jgi:hypothetical protein